MNRQTDRQTDVLVGVALTRRLSLNVIAYVYVFIKSPSLFRTLSSDSVAPDVYEFPPEPPAQLAPSGPAPPVPLRTERSKSPQPPKPRPRSVTELSPTPNPSFSDFLEHSAPTISLWKGRPTSSAFPERSAEKPPGFGPLPKPPRVSYDYAC